MNSIGFKNTLVSNLWKSEQIPILSFSVWIFKLGQSHKTFFLFESHDVNMCDITSHYIARCTSFAYGFELNFLLVYLYQTSLVKCSYGSSASSVTLNTVNSYLFDRKWHVIQNAICSVDFFQIHDFNLNILCVGICIFWEEDEEMLFPTALDRYAHLF